MSKFNGTFIIGSYFMRIYLLANCIKVGVALYSNVLILSCLSYHDPSHYVTVVLSIIISLTRLIDIIVLKSVFFCKTATLASPFDLQDVSV